MRGKGKAGGQEDESKGERRKEKGERTKYV